MFSDNSIFFLIVDNINHFANSAAHIHEVHFYFRCPNALSEKTKEIYKSDAPFAVSQTVHLSGIENGNENSVFLISAYRYAFAGSIVISRKDIVEGNFGEAFIIFAQSPEHYWTFKLNSKFDITLFANHECGLPYVSVTRL